MIKIEKLTKSYNNNFLALDNINLKIEEGDTFGIIGLSGAGKSTLIRSINLLEKPDSGNIFIKNIDITKLSAKELREKRKKIGMIFQSFNLFDSKTVYENIEYTLKISKFPKNLIKNKVLDLLKIVDLEDKFSQYPSNLSGGQKQRVAIARALANNPDILLCDEATSALDPKTTKSILNLLKSIKSKMNLTIVIITHEMEVIREICNKVAVLEKGKIVENSTVENIFKNPVHNTTKDFLSHIRHTPTQDLINGKNIYKLHFNSSNVNKPIISNLIKNFDLNINILSGDINNLYTSKIGNLIVQINFEKSESSKCFKYLEENSVSWEELIWLKN